LFYLVSPSTSHHDDNQHLISESTASYLLANEMHHRKPKRNTTYHKRYNALTAADVQAMQYLQASFDFAFVRQRQARNLFLATLAMGCHRKRKGRLLFLFTLHNYVRKARLTRILLQVDFSFMTVLPDQEVPRLIPTAVNHTFDSLEEDWCYQHTRFTVDQVCRLHDLLQLPPIFNIRGGRAHCSSEEGFIMTMVKLATGLCNATLCFFWRALSSADC
jgi:hypothetical protein